SRRFGGKLLRFPPPKAKSGARDATDAELELAKKQGYHLQQ
ncbi:hypothetical protein MNBD_ALPHA06-1133, partial [hydrothermal vent metagenome]